MAKENRSWFRKREQSGFQMTRKIQKVEPSGHASPAIGSTAGFIFTCTWKTKKECYKNRVFGLPRARLEVVEKIKPGTKLFLFDTEKKVLYGVYEATSRGGIDLEASAFDGKYPAQVSFKIFNPCFPLPERYLRRAIRENYVGNKFKQELNESQVERIVSFLHRLDAPLSSVLEEESRRRVAYSDPPVLQHQRQTTRYPRENQRQWGPQMITRDMTTSVQNQGRPVTQHQQYYTGGSAQDMANMEYQSFPAHYVEESYQAYYTAPSDEEYVPAYQNQYNNAARQSNATQDPYDKYRVQTTQNQPMGSLQEDEVVPFPYVPSNQYNNYWVPEASYGTLAPAVQPQPYYSTQVLQPQEPYGNQMVQQQDGQYAPQIVQPQAIQVNAPAPAPAPGSSYYSYPGGGQGYY